MNRKKTFRAPVLSTLGLSIGTLLTAVIVAWFCLTTVEREVKNNLRTNMQMSLARSIKMYKIWEKDVATKARSIAADHLLQQYLLQLMTEASISEKPLPENNSTKKLRDYLTSQIDQYEFFSFVLLDKNGFAIAALEEGAAGHNKLIEKTGRSFLDLTLLGNTVLTHSLKSEVPISDQGGGLKENLPNMLIATPLSLKSQGLDLILILRLRPEEVFTHIFEIQQSGDSGEMYAFDSSGYLISGSRFDSQLKSVGLLEDKDEINSILNIQLLDPGKDLLKAKGRTNFNPEWPFTRMAQSALNGETGYDFSGYRNYRGVPVVGTWSWFPEFGFGVANEMDLDEAYELIYYLRGWFGILFAILFFTSTVALILGVRQKRWEQQITEAKLRADKANNAKSEFLSRMSHELRTPMNSILGFSQLMEMDPESPLTENQKKCVARISIAGNHLLNLINEVLDISRIETGNLKISMEPVDIEVIVNDVISIVKPLTIDNNISLERQFKLKGNRYVDADRLRLNQIVFNLVSNAIKYNKPNGSVTITLDLYDASKIILGVKDTGPGVPDEMKSKVFKPFERFDDFADSIEGTGIGLTISKQLIELMNGEIGFESTYGEGSFFYIVLPFSSQKLFASDERKTLPPEPKEKRPGLNGTKTILYIEDISENIELVKSVLDKKPDIELISCPNAREGIDLVRTHKPDLILMDIHLPEMNGLTAFEEIRNLEGATSIPVIALTADAMDSEIKNALEIGFHSYITKPINLNKFLDMIDQVLSEPKSS